MLAAIEAASSDGAQSPGDRDSRFSVLDLEFGSETESTDSDESVLTSSGDDSSDSDVGFLPAERDSDIGFVASASDGSGLTSSDDDGFDSGSDSDDDELLVAPPPLPPPRPPPRPPVPPRPVALLPRVVTGMEAGGLDLELETESSDSDESDESGDFS